VIGGREIMGVKRECKKSFEKNVNSAEIE